MVDYKEILRLTSMGYSLRQTAASVGHSHHTVKNVLELAAKHDLEWPIDEDVTNAELENYSIRKEERHEAITQSQTSTTSTVSCRRRVSRSRCSGRSTAKLLTPTAKRRT